MRHRMSCVSWGVSWMCSEVCLGCPEVCPRMCAELVPGTDICFSFRPLFCQHTPNITTPPSISWLLHLCKVMRLLQYQLRVFWTFIHLVPIAEAEKDIITSHGTTWLELFLLFTVRGRKVIRQQLPGESQVLPKFNLLFKTFCRLS